MATEPKIHLSNIRTPRTIRQKTHYCSSSCNSNTYSAIYFPPYSIPRGVSATSLAYYNISEGTCITTNTNSGDAEGIQYTQTMVSNTASSEQVYFKNKNKTKKATPSNDIRQLPFSARTLRSRSHQYGTNLRARVEDHQIYQHLF